MRVLIPILFLLITGCVTFYDGKEVARTDIYDNSYYGPTFKEVEVFTRDYMARRASRVNYSRHWDCDDYSRDYVNTIKKIYAKDPNEPDTIAITMHSVVLIRTVDGDILVDPQNGSIYQ